MCKILTVPFALVAEVVSTSDSEQNFQEKFVFTQIFCIKRIVKKECSCKVKYPRLCKS